MRIRNKVLATSAVALALFVAVGLCAHLMQQGEGGETREGPVSSILRWDMSRYSSARIFTAVAPDNQGFVRFPLASLGGAKGVPAGDLYVNEKYQARFVSSGVTIDFPLPGMPIDLRIIDGRYEFAFRMSFDGTLLRLTYDAAGRLVNKVKITWEGVEFPIFRAAAVGSGRLYWVLYDNKKRKNYLVDVDHVNESSGLIAELPTFYPPAGSTYEMEPPIFFQGDTTNGFELIAGALYARVSAGKVNAQRIENCEVAIEAVFTPSGPAVLCRTLKGTVSPYQIATINTGQSSYLDPAEGIPWGLTYSAGAGVLSLNHAKSREDLLQVFLRDFHASQQGGVLEFGINNIEGRVPWSQIYYLNGLMDLLLLADVNKDAQGIFYPILPEVMQRVVLEVRSLDDLLDTEQGFYTRGFTHDRSLALFAVQTSRLLLLFDRYAEELRGAPPLRNIEMLRRKVATLEGHIDQLFHEGEDPAWMKVGTGHLRWPKGSAFYFDGLPVPFNHQNEWAYALFNSARVKGSDKYSRDLDDQRDIINFYMERLGDHGGFPEPDQWYYWYGHAYDGWTEADHRSLNMPSYSGDHGLAWISFRTIDLMSVMSALNFMGELKSAKLIESAKKRVLRGEVYPFASRSLMAVGEIPQIQLSVLQRYYRASAPWELSNSPWALVMGLGIK